jgi:cob(I)alamin adenosyltransferase
MSRPDRYYTFMKIYTKTGDSGETGLLAGPRIWKDDPRIEAYGTVDELNASLGWARTVAAAVEIDALLARIQHQLFSLGAELATPDPVKRGTDLIGPSQIDELERAIDSWDGRLPPLREFVLPGGSPTAAALHVARGICRRAERRVITLRRIPESRVGPLPVVYLNRLSDLLFVLARAANQLAGCGDVLWRKE